MSLSTRESMRLELKELAKLAQTMAKPSPADVAAADADEIASPMEVRPEALQRPVTPSSSSRVSVVPTVTSTTSVFPPDSVERKTGSAKRTGFVAVLVGAGLAAALFGGAWVGKSLARGPGASTSAVDVRGAAAVQPMGGSPSLAPPAVPAAAPAAEPVVDPGAAPGTPSVAKGGPAVVTANPATSVRKHVAKPASAMSLATTTAPKSSSASNAPIPTSDSNSTPKNAVAASPGLAKPAPKAAAGGGTGDSLEDLIRKEVAAQKK